MALVGWLAGLSGVLLVYSGYLGQTPGCVLGKVVKGEPLPPRIPTNKGFGGCGNNTSTGSAYTAPAPTVQTVTNVGGSAPVPANTPAWQRTWEA